MSNSNYPDGVNGSHPYFNPEDGDCPDCGEFMSNDWNYCPYCGAELPGAQMYDSRRDLDFDRMLEERAGVGD